MALTVWVASGIFSMVGAYCYAELGCMIKKTGGDYAYVMDTFGGFLAFMRLYVESMIIRPCTVAIVSLSFAVYSVKYIFPECEPPDEAVRLLAALCIALLTFVNCYDVTWATRVQDVFTYAKLLALFVIIGTGIIQLGRGKTEYFTWDDTEADFSKIMLSFYSGLFAYNGWNYLNFIIEELQVKTFVIKRTVSNYKHFLRIRSVIYLEQSPSPSSWSRLSTSSRTSLSTQLSVSLKSSDPRPWPSPSPTSCMDLSPSSSRYSWQCPVLVESTGSCSPPPDCSTPEVWRVRCRRFSPCSKPPR